MVYIYRIGILEDEEILCSEIERIILDYSKKCTIKMDVEVFYSGEEICDHLIVPTGAPYTIYTTGNELDTYGYLYTESKTSDGKTLGMIEMMRDDDSGDLTNFMFTTVLTPGNTYYIKVRAFSNSDDGSYTLYLNRY